jgi:hypothetical protein
MASAASKSSVGEQAVALALAQVAAHHPRIEILAVGLQRLVDCARRRPAAPAAAAR